MTETEFNNLADATLSRIEAQLEAADVDVDCDVSGGILTLTFDNDSQVICTRNAPMQELWVAARSGGFHFRFDAGHWINTRDGSELASLLSRVVSEQAGETVRFSL